MKGISSGIRRLCENQIPLRMAGAGQYVTFSDFGVGQRHCTAHRIFTGNHFCLTAAANTRTAAATTGTLLLSAPPVRGANRGVKFSCRLQFGEFQTAGRRFCYWGEEFLFKRNASRRALSLPALPNPYTEPGRRRSSTVLSQVRYTCQQFASETTSDKAFGNVIFCHQRYRIVTPLIGENNILRRTHVVDHPHIGLWTVLRKPATHRHNRRDAAACRQQQEFIFLLYRPQVEFPIAIESPEIITGLHRASATGGFTVINPPYGQGDIFTPRLAWRNRVSTHCVSAEFRTPDQCIARRDMGNNGKIREIVHIQRLA